MMAGSKSSKTKMQLVAPDIFSLVIEWKLLRFDVLSSLMASPDGLCSEMFWHPGQPNCQLRLVVADSKAKPDHFLVGLQLKEIDGSPERQRAFLSVRFRRFKCLELPVFRPAEKSVELIAFGPAEGLYFRKDLVRRNMQAYNGSLHIIARIRFIAGTLDNIPSEILIENIDPWLGSALCKDVRVKGKFPDFKVIVRKDGKIERSFKVHKFILAESSDLLAKAVETANDDSLEIGDFSSEVVYEFLQWLYGHSPDSNLRSERFEIQLLNLAARFNVRQLVRSTTAIVCLNLFMATKHPGLQNNVANSSSPDSLVRNLEKWISNFDLDAGYPEKALEIIEKYRKLLEAPIITQTESEILKDGELDVPDDVAKACPIVAPEDDKVAKRKPVSELWHPVNR